MSLAAAWFAALWGRVTCKILHMGASITYLPNSTEPALKSVAPAVPSFEEALKEVEQAHRQLLMDRLAAKARLAEAIKAVETLEEQAQNRLNAALVSLHCAGGQSIDVADIADDLPNQLDTAVLSVSDALRIEWTA